MRSLLIRQQIWAWPRWDGLAASADLGHMWIARLRQAPKDHALDAPDRPNCGLYISTHRDAMERPRTPRSALDRRLSLASLLIGHHWTEAQAVVLKGFKPSPV